VCVCVFVCMYVNCVLKYTAECWSLGSHFI